MEKTAIRGGRAVREVPFPEWPVWDAKELKAVQDTIKGGVWGIGGPRIKELEEKFASYQDCAHGISVTSGTVALRASLIAAGLPAGCEVIVPAYTFIATVTTVLEVNMIPVIADIDPATCNLSVESAESLITEKTRAIMPVHLAGLPADMDAINALAEKHGLVVIEDACQAWGSEHRGRKTGALSLGGSFSFQSSKHITAGEGGMITTNDIEFAERCRSVINCGRVRGGAWHEHGILGGNYRLSELQAAVLLVQLERYPELLARRRQAAKHLREELGKIEGITPLGVPEYVTSSSSHFMILRYDQESFGGLPKAEFIKALNAEGVKPAHGGYYTPANRQKFLIEKNVGPYDLITRHLFRGEIIDYTKFHCPVTEKLCGSEAIWLLQNLLLADSEGLDHIVRAFRKLRENYRELL